jgi:hypothetical protein
MSNGEELDRSPEEPAAREKVSRARGKIKGPLTCQLRLSKNSMISHKKGAHPIDKDAPRLI